MTDPIISVQNLGKRYRLGQRSDERYVALRDVLTQKAQGIFRRRGNRERLETDNEIWALREVSFEVKQGEVVGIIGRNGAGKSTLLKILSRITEPTEGQVRIKGRVASLLEVGTGFHPELTGRENIFLNGAILGMSRTETRAKFEKIAAFAEIEKFLDTPVKRYSSGMYVRLAFAVAAHLDPEILIVDEVLAVGDIEFQKKCLGKMGEVARGGRTVLFVSHNLRTIQTLCETGILLDAGKIKCRDRAEIVVRRYSESVELRSKINFPSDPSKPSITAIGIDQAELEKGNILVEISFKSPFPLSPPVTGLVISSVLGTPVFGSNPRFHQEGFRKIKLQEGTVRLKADNLPVHAGTYKLSVWLGDWQKDYDEKRDILAFDFKTGHRSTHTPNPEIIGYVDASAQWSVLG